MDAVNIDDFLFEHGKVRFVHGGEVKVDLDVRGLDVSMYWKIKPVQELLEKKKLMGSVITVGY